MVKDHTIYQFLSELEGDFNKTSDQIKSLQSNIEVLKQQIAEKSQEVVRLVEKSNVEYGVIEKFKSNLVILDEYQDWKRRSRLPRIPVVGGSDESD